jgi:hypothetical protein
MQFVASSKLEKAVHPDVYITASYDSGGALKVVEVWDSQQSFERHGQTLMPILKSVGIDAGQPVVSPAHNVISGQ